MKQPYRVGNAIDPRHNDPRYESEKEAYEAATMRAFDRNCSAWMKPIAVWNEDDCIIHLFLCGEIFKPA